MMTITVMEETLPQLCFFWSVFETEPCKANELNLHLLGSVNVKRCLPESFYKVATRWFPFLPSPKKHQSSLALSAHWTHKHSFSLTELTATMNLNSEMHKRSICFNSCFYIAALELLLSRQLVLIASLFYCPVFFLKPSCQGTPTEVFQNKGITQKNGERMPLIAGKGILCRASYMLIQGFSSQLIFISLLTSLLVYY